MKKMIIGIVCLAVIAAAGVPFFNGLIMERLVKKVQGDMNAKYADVGYDVTAEIESYDRGFFSSEVEWKLNLGNIKAFTGVDAILFTERAKHGYTGVVSQTTLEKNSWYAEFIEQKLDGKDPLTMTTEYGLTGNMKSTFKINAFSLPIDSEVLEIKPGEFSASYTGDIQEVQMDGSWQGLEVADKATMEGFSFTSNLKEISNYLWAGDFTMAVKSIDGEEDGEVFQLTNLKLDYDIDYAEQDNKVSMEATYGFDTLIANNETIKDGVVQLAFNNLDVQGYEEFMKAYMGIFQAMMTEIAKVEGDPEKAGEMMQEQMTAMGLQMMTAYEKLLKKDLELKVSEFSVELPAGKIKGDMSLRLNKDMTLAQFMPIMAQPSLLFEIFSLNSAVSFPAELAKEDAQLTTPIMPGMQTGIFIKEGDVMVHKAETKDGELFLNGQKLQL